MDPVHEHSDTDTAIRRRREMSTKTCTQCITLCGGQGEITCIYCCDTGEGYANDGSCNYCGSEKTQPSPNAEARIKSTADRHTVAPAHAPAFARIRSNSSLNAARSHSDRRSGSLAA